MTHWQRYYDRLPVKNVYALPKYIKFLEWHYGDEALLFVYGDEDSFVYFPHFRKRLDDRDLLPSAGMKLRDRCHIHSSWYYGGPLTNPVDPDKSFRSAFFGAWSEYTRGSGAVTEFVRFDANLGNQSLFPESEVAYDRETVFVDLSQDDEAIWMGFNQSNRWAVNRARRDGVEITVRAADEGEYWATFAAVYHSEMERKQAPPHLFFDRGYFDRLRTDLADNVCLVVSSVDSEMCGGVILIFGERHCFGFLSATHPKYWKSQVNNLGWAESVWWAKAQGFEVFDLMGGRPGVFKFKSHFSKARGRFFVRKAVHDSQLFEELMTVSRRARESAQENGEAPFPAYL